MLKYLLWIVCSYRNDSVKEAFSSSGFKS